MMKTIRMLALVLLCGFAVSAQAQNPPAGKPDDKGVVVKTDTFDPAAARAVFLGEYQNHAWGYRHNGWYIDTDGNVYSFHYDLTTNSPDPNKRKYTYHRQLVAGGRIDARTLQAQVALLPSAAKGTYKSLPMMANDAGIFRATAFLRDPKDNRSLRAIPLYQDGDSSKYNDAPEARTVSRWLKATATRRKLTAAVFPQTLQQ